MRHCFAIRAKIGAEVHVVPRSEARKGTALYNIDLIFEKFILDGSSGFSELLCLFAGCAFVTFDLALVTLICPQFGPARKWVSRVQFLTSTIILIIAVFLLWVVSSEFDDDIDFPFGMCS